MAGWGTVGGAVAARVAATVPDCELVVGLVRDPGRHREAAARAGAGFGSGPVVLTTEPEVLLGADCDVVVECTGDVGLAGRLARATLARGTDLVTANKQLLAAHGAELTALADRHRAHLAYEAAVGGGMPIISLVRHALRADRPRRLAAILNGTTNFILDRMAGGEPGELALAAARREGLAEADASADIDAHDPVAKLVILAALLWGGWPSPEDVHRRGIADLVAADLAVARALGRAVRLVALAEAGDGDPAAAGPPTEAASAGAGLALAVEPALVPLDHPLASTRGAGNTVVLDSDLAGRTVLSGTGAGGVPTSSAVLSDLAQVLAARRRGAAPEPGPLGPPPAVPPAGVPRGGAVWRVGPDREMSDPALVAAALSGAGLEVVRVAGLAALIGDQGAVPGAEPGEVVLVTAPATRGRRRAGADAVARLAGGYAVRSCLPLLEA